MPGFDREGHEDMVIYRDQCSGHQGGSMEDIRGRFSL
jgi:hypothetical protein